MMAKRIISADQLRQWAHLVPRLYSKLLATPCFLCGQLTATAPLCPACSDALPRLGAHCPLCAEMLPETRICGRCLRKPPPQQRSFSLFQYRPPVDRCISAFKYHNRLGFSRFFAEQIASNLTYQPAADSVLMPVPLHPWRLRRRGYNQSMELARYLGKLLDIEVNTHCLQRIRNTAPQSALPLKQRQKNLRQAFNCRAPAPERVILVDDVLTSGHTVGEASQQLLRAGCKQVEVWTIARAIRHY